MSIMTTRPGNQDNQDDINTLPCEQSTKSSWGSWFYGKKESTNVPSKAGEATQSYYQNIRNVVSPAFKVASYLASPVVTYVASPIATAAYNKTANFAGKQLFGYFEIPFIDEDVPERIRNLDANNQLPILADTLATMISSQISGKLGTSVNSSTQEALKPSIERILANLACYSPTPIEGEKGQLLTNICKNLYKILNPNEELYSKLRASSPENEDVISTLLNENIQKKEAVEAEIAECEKNILSYSQDASFEEIYTEQSGEFKSLDLVALAKYRKILRRQTQENEALANEIEQLKELKNTYEKYCEEESNTGPDQRNWFLEEFSEIKLVLDFDSITTKILKAAGAEGKVLGYLGGYLADTLKSYNEIFNPSSAYSPNEAAIFSGHQQISEGVNGLVQNALPVLINSKGKEINSLLNNALADKGVDPLWIENFVKSLCNPNEPELQKSLLVIGQCLSQHLIHILEHLASKKLHEGTNLLESSLLNGIELFTRHFEGNETQLQKAIVSFDKNSIQAEAYRAYLTYMKSKGVTKKNLTDNDVKAILAGWDENKRKALIASFPEPNYLLSFFNFREGKHAEEKLNIALMDAFGPLAAEVILEAGLDQNVLLNMFVKKENLMVSVAKGLLELYRMIDGPNDRTQGMGKVIQDFFNDLSPKLKAAQNVNANNKLSNYKKLLVSVTEGRNLGSEAIGMFAKTLSDFSTSWLVAIQKALDSQEIVSESSLKKLEILDPKFQLAEISESLSKKGFQVIHDTIVEKLQDESRFLDYWNLLIDACQRRDTLLANKGAGAKAADLTEAEIAQICIAGNYDLKISNKDIFAAIRMFTKDKKSGSAIPAKKERIAEPDDGPQPASLSSLAGIAEPASITGFGEVLVDFFRNTDSEQLSAEKIKKCLARAPTLAKSYAAINNTTETPEFKPFVELFLSKTVQRILSNLACSCEDTHENGLLSNIVKSLVSALTLGDHEDISSQKNGLDAVEKILGEYAAAVSDCKELEDKYSATGSTVIHPDLIEKQKIVKEFRDKISGSILAKAGLKSASDLQLVVLPFANAVLEDSAWECLNNQLPDLLIKFCKGLKYDTLLSSDKKTAVESLEGYAELKSDSEAISSRLMPKIFNALSSNSKRSMLGHVSKDLLDNMAIEGLERAWIEELLKTLADNVSDETQIGNSTIRHLWKILESILAPRLLGVMENAAIHKNVQGNFFENMIVNSVNVIQNSIDRNQSILNAGLIEYDKKCLKAEACDWRDRYLKDVKGIKTGACDVAALSLTSADIGEILKLYAVGYSSHKVESQRDVNYSIKRIWDLKKALANTDKPEENIADALTHFFMEASNDSLKKEQQECLTRVFGPASDQVLKLIGFTSDKALSLFDTDFAFVRESVIPLVISIIYRDMSDFKGVHAQNNEKLETYFGENKEALEDALNVINKQEIVAKSINGYLKSNGAKLANKLKDFLPKSSVVLGNTIEKYATATSVTGENSHPSQLATNRITSFIEDLVHANLVQVLISICEGSPVTEKQQGDGIFGYFSMKASTIASYLKAPEVKNNPEELQKNELLKKAEEIRKRKELEEIELLKKREIPSALLKNFITQMSHIFAGQRDYLKTEMAKIQPLLAELRKTALEQNWSAEKLKEEEIALRRPIFLSISRQYIEMSGLSAKNLYCPESMQDEIWKGISDAVIPDLISQCYSDLTSWEIDLENDKKIFITNNVPNGSGAAKGLAHYAIKFVQSRFAINGNRTAEGLFNSLILFFKNSQTQEGGHIVRLLSHEATKIAFKNSIDNNLSDVAKATETEQVFLALEAFLEPIVGKALLGLSENLNAVEENNPECLHEIVKDSILAITDHFKKLRAVALSHNVANAYDLTQSQLMKGMTLDGVARKYVFLEAKVMQAQKKRDAAEAELKQWRILGLNEEERLSFESEKANAEQELKAAKEIADVYVAKNWPNDNGAAMKNYLSYERALTAARTQVTFAEKRRSEWFTDQENIECEIQASHQEFNRIERELRDARYELKNQLIDPFSCPIYIKFLEDLEGDLTPDNRIKVQNEMNKYTVGLFKPLADDLLSLINVDQFDEIPFLGLLGEELKKNKVQEIKDKLPEILHQIFETVGEPTTFLSLFNSILEGQSSSENVPVKDVEEADDYSDENDDFDIIGGQVVMEAIKLMPSRVEEALFMITKVKGATQEAAGKAVGAKLRKFLKTQTLPNLFNTILKSSVTAVLPKATWSDAGELILGNEAKMPQTAAELKRVETAKQLEAQQLFYKVKNGFAALSEQVIKNTIQDKINAVCKSVNNVTSAVIKTILNEQRAQQVISALNAFTNFIYNIIATLIRVIAMPFWAVVRLLILAPKSAQIAKAIGSNGHKRLVFQLPVIFLEIIKRERQKLEQKRADAALEQENEKEVLIESEEEVSEVLFEI